MNWIVADSEYEIDTNQSETDKCQLCDRVHRIVWRVKVRDKAQKSCCQISLFFFGLDSIFEAGNPAIR